MYLFPLGAYATVARHDLQAFVRQAQVGDPLPWVKLEVHDCLDCRSLQIHAAVNWDMLIVCPMGHLRYELPLADIDVFACKDWKYVQMSWSWLPFLTCKKLISTTMSSSPYPCLPSASASPP